MQLVGQLCIWNHEVGPCVLAALQSVRLSQAGGDQALQLAPELWHCLQAPNVIRMLQKSLRLRDRMLGRFVFFFFQKKNARPNQSQIWSCISLRHTMRPYTAESAFGRVEDARCNARVTAVKPGGQSMMYMLG